jgi:hydrogenase expression/formation protein HypC
MCLAVPGKLETISGDDPLFRSGRVSFSGVLKEVSLACLPEAQVGDYVLVHVGMAIGRVDEEEALKIFGYLREMNELADLEEASPPP